MKIAMGAGAVMLLASFLPWVSEKDQFAGFLTYGAPAGVRLLSLLFALGVIGAAFAVQLPQSRRPSLLGGLAASGVALIMYALLMVRGWVGKDEIFGTKITWNPGVGLVFAFLAATVSLACYAILSRPRSATTPSSAPPPPPPSPYRRA